MSELATEPAQQPSTPQPPARRSPARQLLWPGLAMLAVAAVAAGAVQVAHLAGGGPGPAAAPPPLHLAGTDTAAGSAVAEQMPAPLGAPTVAGPLPAGPARERVRTLAAGAAPAGTVGALARALGLAGTPTRTADGWQLASGDRVLQVAGTAGLPWLLGGKPPSGTTCGVVGAGGVVGSGRAPLCPPAVVLPAPPDGAGTSGSSGAGGAPAGLPQPAGPPTEVAVAGSDSLAPDRPVSTGTAVQVPGRPLPVDPRAPAKPVPAPPRLAPPTAIPVQPLPVPARPTDADALLAARPVLAALGLVQAPTQVRRLPGQVVVVADPVVDGLPTSGFDTTLQVAPDRSIVGGHGWLGHPVAGAEYPLLSAAEAVKQIATPAIARECGKVQCPAQPMVITGARLGLMLTWNATAQVLLVPAWRYDVRGVDTPLVIIAVQPAYRGSGPGLPADVPLPAPLAPGGQYPNGGGGAPGQEPAAPPTR
jgi:hypothetical protein